MAYVNVADWNPEQVTEWLKGLDSVILPYIHSFVNNEVDGQQLLSLRPDDLEHRGITKVGHQEVILEAVEHLRNFHFELDRENVQLLALRLSCQAHSLYKTLKVEEQEQASSSTGKSSAQSVSTQTLADVAGVVDCIKPLAHWLDRPPFSDLPIYQDLRTNLLTHGLNIAICAQRDRFAERPLDDIRQHCQQLAELADQVIQEYSDPLILQPASLDLASIRRRAGDELGFFLAPSLSGAPQIVEVKLQGAAHQSGKVEEGDEIVQVNYQTVVGWRLKAVSQLLVQEPSAQVFLTLKKRPRHSNVYGQIYIKPYRLPSRKRNPQFIRWHEPASPRPELLTIPHFVMPQATTSLEVSSVSHELLPTGNGSSDASDEEDDSAFIDGDPEVTGDPSSSPSSVRLRLPRPRSAVQRRATVTCASPTTKHPPEGVEQLRAEIQREMQRRGLPTPKRQDEPTELRSKSGSAVSLACRRPCTMMGSCSSESEPRTPFSPLSPLRAKVYQSSSSPLSPPAYQAPSSPRSPPPSYLKAIPLPTPTYIPKTTTKCVLTTVTITPPEAIYGSQQMLDILPSMPMITPITSTTLSPNINQVISSILDDDGTGETLHERAVDCSPIPPPRPASSMRGAAVITPRAPPTEPRPSSSLGSTRNLVARTVSRTKQRLSPRTDRKKTNNLLSKGRAVSYKQLGEIECEGWLLQRARAAAGASWSRAWFALKDTALYGFSSTEAKKADKLISLPGFTASAAPEVKSRQFAFKVYHTGTAFYFAAGCAEELQRWLGCLGAATLGIRTDSTTPYFSETEDEEQLARPPARAASSGNVSGDQENRSDERRFGSLRRLAGGWRTDEATSATSLDRKYLQRLLRQEAVVPVPTAQFRSYRRVDRGVVSPTASPGLDAAHSRTLPSRLGGSRQPRIMSVESVTAAVSTTSLPAPQGLVRDSSGSSPHLAAALEPTTTHHTEKAPRRILRLFSPVLGRKLGGSSKPSDGSQALGPQPPTLLGSPKLHRALFRGRRHAPQASNVSAVQPRRIPPTLPEDSPPPVPAFHPDTVVPDYPGLEYPPVFEPGTYTLNPEAREQWRSTRNNTNTRHVPTNRTLLLPKPKDACWPTQSMNLSPQRSQDMPSQRRIKLTPQGPRRHDPGSRRLPAQPSSDNAEQPRRPSNQKEEAVLIPPLDLLSATDV